jgi:hypothetical protein
MAEAIKGSVILKSVPNRETEYRVSAHLAGIYREVPADRIVALVSRTKPLTVVKGIPETNGKRLARELTGLGAVAFFLQDLGSVNRH